MPIIGDYTWIEKREQFIVTIPLKGVSPGKVDIRVAKRSLKVNYAPYFLDLVLHDEVDSLKHKALVKDKALHITLYKSNNSNHYMWGTLVAQVDDKNELRVIKNESLQAQEKLQEELEKQRHERRIDEERNAVRKQMNLDEMERNRLEEVKLEEKKAAEKDLYETFNQLSMQTKTSSTNKKVHFAGPTDPPKSVTTTSSTTTTITTNSNQQNNPNNNSNTTTNNSNRSQQIFNNEDIEDDIEDDIDESADEKNSNEISEDRIREEIPDDENIRYIPPPRQSTTTTTTKQTIHFTPRIFPTPMRESKLAEEEDWIAKNRRHLKHHGVLGKNLPNTSKNGKDITEESSIWLKAKADDFFRHHDYLSAVNAYSAAIDGDPELLPCYSNRATCYLKLQLFSQCKLDCDVIINQIQERLNSLPQQSESTSVDGKKDSEMTPTEIEKEKLQILMLKSLLKRGAAQCSLGKFTESLSDFMTALNKFHQLRAGQLPHSITAQTIQADIDRLKLLVHCETLKREGDAHFAAEDFLQAIEQYNAVLLKIPVHVSALSNRAASYMALQEYRRAIEDCSRAVEILSVYERQQRTRKRQVTLHNEVTTPENDALSTMLLAILPSVESEKFRQWLLRTLVRQALAHVEVDELDQAIAIYERATAVDPKNEQIRNDLENLLRARNQGKTTLDPVESE